MPLHDFLTSLNIQSYIKFCFICQGRRKLFYGGGRWGGGGQGLHKTVNHHGWLTKKNINDSKSHIWNSCFFFKKILFQFRAYNFFIFVHTFQWTLSELFFSYLIFQQKVLKPIKTSERVHSFYNRVLIKKPHSFYERQLT